MRYEHIRKGLKTGDIVLFSGKGAISHSIKLVTKSKWSHVGMVLQYTGLEAVFLWESTKPSGVNEAIDGKAKRGVQLALLSDRLRDYVQNHDGQAAIRILKGYAVNGNDYEKLMAFRQKVKNRPYEKDKIELIKAAYDGPFGQNEEDLSSLFCSELVAEAYQKLGLLKEPPQGLPSNEFVPKDFAEKRGLVLERNASLGKEIAIEI